MLSKSFHLFEDVENALGSESSDKHAVRRHRVLLFRVSAYTVVTLRGAPELIRYYEVGSGPPIGIGHSHAQRAGRRVTFQHPTEDS